MRIMNQLDLFFELALDMQAVVAADGHFSRINEAWVQNLGWSESELKSRPYLSFVHPDDAQKLVSYNAQSMPEIIHLRWKCKAGAYRDFSVKLKSISSNETLMAATDITDEKNFKMYFREIERVAKIGFWSYDLVSHEVHWSDEIYHIHDMPVGTPVDLDMVYSHYIPEHRSILAHLVEQCIADGTPYDLELCIKTFSGQEKWARCIGHPRFENNKVVALYGVFQDVSSYRYRLFDYLDSQKRLKIALSANNMGVWDWNVKDDYLEWDDNMFKIFEIKREDFTNNFDGIGNVFHPDDKERIVKAVDHSITTGAEFNTWFRIITPTAKVKYIAARGRLANTDPDKPWLIGVNWDITKEKEQESTIRTQQAQMVTSARLSSLGEMAGGIAHEINNPLSVILGRANQLKRKLDTNVINHDELMDGLSNIEETCERIVKIIKGLRAFSRNAENDPLAPVDVEQVINDVIILISEKFKYNNVKLTFESHFKGSALGRSVQLGQVLMNLLSNAYDAIADLPEKWVKIELLEQNKYLVIKICDSGPGIPPEIYEKMFQPFFTTKEVGAGTGLGLPIAKGIIEDHGGSLSIDSKNKHTCFVIKLPKN